MHVLDITERFFPEITAPSFRVMEHAKIWRSLSADVTVLTCAPNFPSGKLFPGYRNARLQEEIIDGIRVIRVLSYMTANQVFSRRALDYASFMLLATRRWGRIPRCDVPGKLENIALESSRVSPIRVSKGNFHLPDNSASQTTQARSTL